MPSVLHRAVLCSASVLVSFALVGGIAQTATAETDPPTPPPGSSTTAPSSDEMNAAHDHTMGYSVESEGRSPQLQTPNQQTSAGPTPSVDGEDVSGWQGDLDWNAEWAKGARFAYVKATESNNATNSHFASQWRGSNAVGMIRGAYHFANPFESSGTTQADYFLANGGSWSTDQQTLPPVLDIETNPYPNDNGQSVNSCYNLTPAQMVSWISDFSGRVYAATGIRPTIYTTTSWWQSCTGGSTAFSANALFIANWRAVSNGPGALPSSWTSYAMWQHSDTGTFAGDQDVFNGDMAALKKFAGNITPTSNYLDALYQDYLNRLPAPLEIASWQDAFAAGAPRSSVAAGFVNSDEYRLSRIDAAYLSILGRPAEPNGRLSWLATMKSGGITTDDIETSLYASDEYYQKNGGTDTSFIACLYSTLLHRQGSPQDYAAWSTQVAQHGRAAVISQFWDANETISQRVSAMYQLYLGRVPDSAGLASWVNLALQIGDSGLRSGFTSSDEYFNRAQTRTFTK